MKLLFYEYFLDLQTEHFETSSLNGENVGKAKQWWLHKINSPFCSLNETWILIWLTWEILYFTPILFFVEAVFLRIGEDYVRNMHSYPENQPKQEGIVILCSVYIAYSYWTWL